MTKTKGTTETMTVATTAVMSKKSEENGEKRDEKEIERTLL